MAESTAGSGPIEHELRPVRRGRNFALRLFAKNTAATLAALVLVVIATAVVFAPSLAPRDPLDSDLRRLLEPPNPSAWLGTDYNGRDILSRLLYGGRITLSFGLLAVLLGFAIGVPLGLVSGYFKSADLIVQRVVDVLMSIPQLLLAVGIVAVLGSGLYKGALAIGIGAIPTFARLTRSAVLAIREQEYVAAAQASGASHGRVMVRHILPNALSPLIVYSALEFASAIKLAAILGFLGLGVQPPTPEWGAMISTARDYMFQAPHMIVVPGLALTAVVLATNVLGDALRDVLDPRTNP